MIENPDKFNLRIRNIEVVQTVQNTLHDVPLIAGKRTYVRVYIAPDPSIAGLPIAGELCAINDAGKVTGTFPAIEHSQLDQEISTHQQRLDWSRSLNFLLPQNFWDCSPPAPISFELTRAWCIAPNGERVEFTNIADEENNTRVDFVKDPEMHCRIVIYRYQDGDNQRLLQPGSGEVAAIQHRVENIFPVAAVNWSSIIISAPDEFRALEAISQNNTSSDEQTTLALVKLFNHLQVIREQDILHGRDPGTLYLGLLSDPTGRLGGAAMDSPQFAAPHTVAISSTDSDGQLGAHELAHALGCRHPGIPDIKLHGRDIGQRRETDAENHSLHGYLSENLDTSTGEIHLGLDARYGTASPAVLAHDQYFDLMTYRHPQWISAVTYSNLHRRLQESRKANYSINPKASKYWTVIGEYDLIRKTGRIHYLGPTKYLTPVPESINQPLLKLAWHIDEFGSRQAEVPVYIKDLEKLDGSRSIGVFQHTLTTEKELKSLGHTIDSNGPLKLLIGELVVDQIGGQDIETTSNAIDELISQLVSRRQTSEPSLLALSYSVEDDAYYIDYQWPEKLVGNLRLTTSLACQRGGQKDRRPPVWETIALSQRLKNRVWISPEFFNNSAAKLNSEGIKETSYGNPLLLEGQIRAQQLDIKIGFSTGFVSGFFTATLSLSSIESPANRNDGSSYRP